MKATPNMSTFFRTQMTGRRGNPLVLRKILPTPDLVIASTRADIGFYIVSLVGQVIINYSIYIAINLLFISQTINDKEVHYHIMIITLAV